MRALRLPAPITESLIYSLLRPNPFLPVRSLAVQASARARPVYSLVPLASRIGRLQDLPGFWRFHPVPLPCSQTPAGLSGLTMATRQCCPHRCKSEDTLRFGISRLSHTASVPATYASSSALPHSHAKLASRLLVRLCREGVEPSGIQRMVSAHTSVLPPFPVLSWRYTTPIRNPLWVNNFSCDCPGAGGLAGVPRNAANRAPAGAVAFFECDDKTPSPIRN